MPRAKRQPAPPTASAELPLKNPRHELFVSFIASGRSFAEAYVAAGFSASGARSCAPRLLRNVAIDARLKHLRSEYETKTAARVSIDREWVLQGLKIEALDRENGSPSSRVRAFELLGKEMGLFVDRHDHTMKWDGNPASLTEAQQATLIAQLEALVFQGDAVEIAAARREALQLGPAVDVTGEAVQ